MNNDTKPMTAEETKTLLRCMDVAAKKHGWTDYLQFVSLAPSFTSWDKHEEILMDAAKIFARAVAEQVRQQCAEKAKIRSGTIFDRVDRESILSVDIEALIK